MKYLFIFLTIVYGCNSAPKPEIGNSNPNSKSISELLNDTFVDIEEPKYINSDSLEKAIFKQLHFKDIKSIETYDVEKLSLAYSDLMKHLAKSKDSTQSEQNKILYQIFDKLNSQQNRISDTAEIEINAKLKIARMKSEIWPYFKK